MCRAMRGLLWAVAASQDAHGVTHGGGMGGGAQHGAQVRAPRVARGLLIMGLAAMLLCWLPLYFKKPRILDTPIYEKKIKIKQQHKKQKAAQKQ